MEGAHRAGIARREIRTAYLYSHLVWEPEWCSESKAETLADMPPIDNRDDDLLLT